MNGPNSIFSPLFLLLIPIRPLFLPCANNNKKSIERSLIMDSKMPSGDPPAISIPRMTRLKASVITAMTRSTRRRDGTINRTLLAALDWKAKPSAKPIKGISTSDHTVDASRGLWVRLFSPAAVQSDAAVPIIVYFHGGGFAYHSAATLAYDALCRRIARAARARVVSVEYRLAPEHRFPAAYDDCFDALRWIDDADLCFSSVFLAGDSAGGNIAHHVAHRAVAEKEALRRVRVSGVVEIQPFFGGEVATESELRLDGMVPFGSRESYEWMWRTFLPAGSSLDGKWSNVFGPDSESGSADWTDFPATMVIIGGLDLLQDRQRMYCEGIRGRGVEVRAVEYSNAFHAFFVFTELPEAKKMMVDIADFVRTYSPL